MILPLFNQGFPSMTHATYLQGLNAPQHEAVTAPLEHLLILAGAGSGKTRVLVSRVAWLMNELNLGAHQILAVTFTNKAAGEMKSRLHHLMGYSLQNFWVGTFHGLCHRLLRRHYIEARLPETFHILDSDDSARMIKRAIASLNLDVEQWPIKEAQAFIGARKDEGLRPKHIAAPSYGPIKTWVKIYEAYDNACQASGVVDFAELLLRGFELIRHHPEIQALYQNQFRAILVDEFQDTNAIQYAWIRLMAGADAVVMAVGDDDQSIYGWRGAKVENIQKFTEDFRPSRMIRLEQNYRSTGTILDAANALITHNESRMGKDLWTKGSRGEKIKLFAAFNELEEARFVADRVALAHAQGLNWDDVAVLYRSNAQSRVLEEALLHAQIPYRIYGGMRFFERAEVKDALAYVRLMVNANDDQAFERVVNMPTRGLGEKTLNDVRETAKQQGISLWQASLRLLDEKYFPARASNALMGFMQLILSMQQATKEQALDDMMTYVLNNSGLRTHVAGLKGGQAESRLENLQELENAAREFRDTSFDEEESMPLISAFLAHASLEAGEKQVDEHVEGVRLMTLHAAKGLEFPWVFLVGLEEGLFPGRQSMEDPLRLEEERRLCYVGMTRAMVQLIISYAEVRRQYGREEYHRPSRFLREIPAEFLDEVRPKARFQPAKLMPMSRMVQQHDSGFGLGQTVHHAHFGDGVVLDIEGSGAHTRVQVNFVDAGIKWLVVAYANLT